PRLDWIQAQRACRYGIDRWAGRCFDTDEQRLTWWKANRNKTPEQWLRDSLPIAVARAVPESKGFDNYLFHELLPDAPYTDYEPAPFTWDALPATSQEDHQSWFAKHRGGPEVRSGYGRIPLVP